MKLSDLSRALCGDAFPSLSGNIYCIGRNYSEHAKELGNDVPSEPVVFLKAPSALRTLEGQELAFPDESIHHEVEVVLLIGRTLRPGEKISEDVIAGVSLGLDLTRRDVQSQLKKQGLPWTTAKSFAGAGILHRFVKRPGDLNAIHFALDVNDRRVQSGQTGDMIFDWKSILTHLLRYQDLEAGDVIFTGTPSGVGPFKKGDTFRLQSETLGIDARARL